MPKRKDIKKILVVGAGPIIIGQACEFDYSGSQALRSLKEDGIETILINSNPATIMTDPVMADHIYLLPLTTKSIRKIQYSSVDYELINGTTYIKTSEGNIPLEVFGDHNLSNLCAAKQICSLLGVFDDEFYAAIANFKGASNRLETIYRDNSKVIIKDFAHSPSKLKASIDAVKKQFSNKNIIAVYELHTFSSFSKDFINEYYGTMSNADTVSYTHLTLPTKRDV